MRMLNWDALPYPLMMGILNVTPDSFSDGGIYEKADSALQQAQVLIASGAGILDIGGESTRPGFTEVSAEEESTRIIPVIQQLARITTVPISVDTRKAAVAQEALKAGAAMVNDISGGTFDPAILQTAASFSAAVCLGHVSGKPENWHTFHDSADIVAEVIDQLKQCRDAARNAGIAQNQIFLDPGIGFGKTPEQNLMILERIGEFRSLGCRLTVGVSRKRFLGGQTLEEKDRITAEWTARLFQAGVDAVRVHRCLLPETFSQ